MGTIQFKEGSFHLVTLTLPEAIDLSRYIASIQVRETPTSAVRFKFSTEDGTLIKSGQNLILNIPAFISLNRATKYKWQLGLYTNSTDVILFEYCDFIIDGSVNKVSSSVMGMAGDGFTSQNIVLELPNVIPDSLIPDLREFVLVRGDVNFAVFEIDENTGELIVTYPFRYSGPEFSINETGELILTI